MQCVRRQLNMDDIRGKTPENDESEKDEPEGGYPEWIPWFDILLFESGWEMEAGVPEVRNWRETEELVSL